MPRIAAAVWMLAEGIFQLMVIALLVVALAVAAARELVEVGWILLAPAFKSSILVWVFGMFAVSLLMLGAVRRITRMIFADLQADIQQATRDLVAAIDELVGQPEEIPLDYRWT